MKRSEINRFFNCIAREKNEAVKSVEGKLLIANSELSILKDENKKLTRDINSIKITFDEMAADITETESRYKSAIAAITRLLPKIRVDIWSGKTSTPRYFESGKWWSRETGNLDAEFVSEMTDEEKIEAIDFYGTTELPFMAKPSMRDELAHFEAAKCLWYRYMALPEQRRSEIEFPQFCGLCRAEYKNNLKAEIEEQEKNESTQNN